MSKESAEKLQTVRGAGWPAAWFLFPGREEIFLRRVLSRERRREQLEGGSH